MDTFSIAEVVEMAIRTEKLGHSYYTELAAKFKDKRDAWELFTKLAEQEAIHEERFKYLKGTLGEVEATQWEEVSEYMRAYVESAFFLGRDKAFAHMQNITEPNAAVGLAIGFEKETLLFFYGMRDFVKEKEIVDEIIKEEKSHIVWLNRFKSRYSK